MEESEKTAEKGENKEQRALVTEGNDNNNSRCCSLWTSSLPEALAGGEGRGGGLKAMLPEDSNLGILINLKQMMSILGCPLLTFFFF